MSVQNFLAGTEQLISSMNGYRKRKSAAEGAKAMAELGVQVTNTIGKDDPVGQALGSAIQKGLVDDPTKAIHDYIDLVAANEKRKADTKTAQGHLSVAQGQLSKAWTEFNYKKEKDQKVEAGMKELGAEILNSEEAKVDQQTKLTGMAFEKGLVENAPAAVASMNMTPEELAAKYASAAIQKPELKPLADKLMANIGAMNANKAEAEQRGKNLANLKYGNKTQDDYKKVPVNIGSIYSTIESQISDKFGVSPNADSTYTQSIGSDFGKYNKIEKYTRDLIQQELMKQVPGYGNISENMGAIGVAADRLTNIILKTPKQQLGKYESGENSDEDKIFKFADYEVDVDSKSYFDAVSNPTVKKSLADEEPVEKESVFKSIFGAVKQSVGLPPSISDTGQGAGIGGDIGKNIGGSEGDIESFTPERLAVYENLDAADKAAYLKMSDKQRDQYDQNYGE